MTANSLFDAHGRAHTQCVESESRVTSRHPSPAGLNGSARTPCVAGDDRGETCVVGLLLGVACCDDGRCAYCEAMAEQLRKNGFDEAFVVRSRLRSRRGLLTICPACGLPAPPAPRQLPPLPRLDRSERKVSGAPNCKVCDAPLKPPQRFYCGRDCWLERRRRTEGWGHTGKRRDPPVTARGRVLGM